MQVVEFPRTQIERLLDDTEIMDSRVSITPRSESHTEEKGYDSRAEVTPQKLETEKPAQWEEEEMQLLPETPKHRVKGEG